jgi:phosphoribosylformylglycinamidine synthase
VYLASIHVTLKKSVLDPQGVTVKGALESLGFRTVSDVRVGKYFQVSLDAESEESARAMVLDMCKKLLANPVIEQFDFDVSPGGAAK